MTLSDGPADVPTGVALAFQLAGVVAVAALVGTGLVVVAAL